VPRAGGLAIFSSVSGTGRLKKFSIDALLI
jgi:hypothetical protein